MHCVSYLTTLALALVGARAVQVDVDGLNGSAWLAATQAGGRELARLVSAATQKTAAAPATNPTCQLTGPNPWPSDCTCAYGWVQGDASGGSQTFLGNYDTCKQCLQMVLSIYPSAAGATFRAPGSSTSFGECYVEHAWLYPDGDLSWVTIPIPASWAMIPGFGGLDPMAGTGASTGSTGTGASTGTGTGSTGSTGSTGTGTGSSGTGSSGTGTGTGSTGTGTGSSGTGSFGTGTGTGSIGSTGTGTSAGSTGSISSSSTGPISASGAAGSAAAVGDPHLENIHGERFDVMRPGKHVLIHIPRGERVEKAMLRVEAEASRLGGSCAEMYFMDLNITGAWVEARQIGGLRFHAQDAGDKNLNWAKFGKVELKVAHGRTPTGTQYLNFYVKHLGHAGFNVGGLLGEDDHEEAAMPSPACAQRLSLIQSAD